MLNWRKWIRKRDVLPKKNPTKVTERVRIVSYSIVTDWSTVSTLVSLLPFERITKKASQIHTTSRFFMKLKTHLNTIQVCRVVFNEILTNSSFKQLLMIPGVMLHQLCSWKFQPPGFAQVEGLSNMISLEKNVWKKTKQWDAQFESWNLRVSTPLQWSCFSTFLEQLQVFCFSTG